MTNHDSENHYDTYHSIVRTAQELFMELGYRAVSTRQIAERCGVTQPALYHHFKSKQNLYVAVLEYTLMQTEEALTAILANTASFSLRLQRIALYMMETSEMNLSQMFHDIFHELTPEQRQRTQKLWIRGFLMPVVTMLDEAIEEKQIRNLEDLHTDSTELAYLFLNLIKSALEPVKRENPTIMASEVSKKAKLIIEIFLNGISNPSSR